MTTDKAKRINLQKRLMKVTEKLLITKKYKNPFVGSISGDLVIEIQVENVQNSLVSANQTSTW